MGAIRMILRRLRTSEEGATAIEYGLIAALIAVACIGGLNSLGGGADGLWTKIDSHVESAM